MSIQNKSLKLTAVAVTAFALSVSAMAATTKKLPAKKKPVIQSDRSIEPTVLEPSNISATNKASVTVAEMKPAVKAGKKPLPLSLSDYSLFNGPKLTKPTETITPDSSNDAVTGLSSRHMVSLTYKANKGISFGPTADFNIQHTQANAGEQKGVNWNDSYFKVGKSGIMSGKIGANAVALDGSIRYLAPTSKTSRDNKSHGSVRMDLNPNITFGKSALSLTIYNFGRAHLLSQGSNATGTALTQYQIYTGPTLNYDFNDKVGAFVLYEASLKFNTLGESQNQYDPSQSLTDLEPGVNINLNKHISIAPYLNWYTAQPLNTTSINMSASLAM